MGELLARNEVFLFTVNLVQRLQFLPPVNNLAPDPANYHAGLTNIPDDFYTKLCLPYFNNFYVGLINKGLVRTFLAATGQNSKATKLEKL